MSRPSSGASGSASISQADRFSDLSVEGSKAGTDHLRLSQDTAISASKKEACRIAHGAIEVINGIIQLAKRLPGGFRDFSYLLTIAYLVAAKLKVPLPSMLPTYNSQETDLLTDHFSIDPFFYRPWSQKYLPD
jgi:hypothetical protein